ncbi:MAG: MXAN_5808 family serine peptidase [bacterium]
MTTPRTPVPGSKFIKRFSFFLILVLTAFSASFFLRDGKGIFTRASVAPVAEGDLSDFSKAELTRQTLNYIGHNYYDAGRINPKQMLKGGLMAMGRGVSEIVVDFPDNTARITVAVENSEKKFTLPVFQAGQTGLEQIVPFLQQVYYFIEKNYKGETELADIERMTLNGMLETLDPHSSLLAPKIFKEFKTQTEGEFGGLGIVIGLKDGDLTVISPLEGTPAWKAGIKTKDKILKINTEATINMNLNEAVEKLRGKVGSQVILTISREGIPEPFEVTLTRAKIKIESIQSKLLKAPEGDVGYVKVKSFQEDTYRELVRNLHKLKDQSKNFKGLILDFRNNPGGLLSQAVQIADLFLENGVIVSTVGAGDKIREVEEAKVTGTEDRYPIMVLVNDSSASASEIVAGALKNNNRAVAIGQQTFGKGSVQSVFSLRDASALKLTIAQYLTPGNESIQSVGITPDIQLVPATVAANDTHILEADGFREKDLEKHLESSLSQTRKPIYVIRYFVPKKASPESGKAPKGKDKNKDKNKDSDKDKEEDPDEFSTELKLDNDYYVKLANRIILAAPSSDRQAILKATEPIEKESEQEENQKIGAAMSAIGIDWSKGNSSENPQAQVSFSVEGKQAPTEPLIAGEEAKLTLRVKNVGPGDFYQLIAKTESENPLFKNKEFVFGHLKSGETRSWTTKVKVPESGLSREDEVKFVFKEANNKVPDPFTTLLVIQPKSRPSFAYSYRLEGVGSGGLQKGQKVNMVVTVKNLGLGKSKETVVNLKNLEGEGVFISEGRSKLGELDPGASKEAKLSFTIDKSFSKPKVGVELSIVDTSIGENLIDKMSLGLGKEPLAPPQDVLQKAPVIQLTGIDGTRSTTAGRFYVSGTVTSDNPLKDVIIFVGDNKAYLKSADGDSPKKITFSSQVPLEVKNNNSNNLIIVLARDQRDLTGHKSFFIRKKP